MRRAILYATLLPAGLSGHAAAAEVWAAPAVFKVRPEARVQESNLVWDGRSRTVRLAGAKNEHVPFQIIISVPPPPSRQEPPAGGFFVEASALESADGRIPSERIRLYLEHVVLCYAKSGPAGDTGFWPDALAPLAEPFSMAAPFRQAVRHRGVWVDIVTPADIPAGEYTGKIRVTQHGNPIAELQVRLRVYDFALPQETHLVTYMGLSGRRIALQHEVPVGSARAGELLKKYHGFLYENRMEPWFNEMLQPRLEITGDGVAVHFDEGAYDLYLRQWKTKRVVLEAGPSELRRAAGAEPFSETFNRRVKSYLGQVAEYFRRNGWLERLVFNSPIDEPNSAEQYEETRRWARLVHEAAPGVPFLATEAPVPDNPDWGPLTGFVHHFSVHGNALNRLEVREAIRREQERGGEITWYISCDQIYPQPNYFIDAPAMDPVMVPWITWKYKMNGILYWALDYWTQTADPWLDPVTYLSGFFCSRGGVLNGEGSLLYPGSRVRRHTGQPDVDGPVSSIRFELLREGMEDYEYLWLLRSLGEGALADQIVQELVVDVSAFSRNPAALFAAREKLARRIEELVTKRGGRR